MTGEMSATYADGIRCYRCGADLARLTLPIGRLDLCPACGIELHVCRMCAHFAPSAPDGCIEEEAEAVNEKARANFCEYYRPGSDAFDGAAQRAEQQAREGLAALFGDAAGGDAAGSDGAGADTQETGPDDDDPLAAARALFDR